jgi:hypothetical protein
MMLAERCSNGGGGVFSATTSTNNPMHGSGEVGRFQNGQTFVAAP